VITHPRNPVKRFLRGCSWLTGVRRFFSTRVSANGNCVSRVNDPMHSSESVAGRAISPKPNGGTLRNVLKGIRSRCAFEKGFQRPIKPKQHPWTLFDLDFCRVKQFHKRR
jgi:hypothetical protein